ncbi:hypothetical protein QJQ45_015823 [Haematococcus lacustris]|nr:hypothetical protein QJQ45_015823 [Haematococcus lacustris]
MSNPTANFAPFESKCRSAGLTEAAIAAFRHNYEQLAAGATGLVPEDEIEAVSNLPYLNDMSEPEPSKVKPLLSRTAVLKLNGGLGTSMGLEKAKSLLVVKDKHSFLDLIALQAGTGHPSHDLQPNPTLTPPHHLPSLPLTQQSHPSPPTPAPAPHHPHSTIWCSDALPLPPTSCAGVVCRLQIKHMRAAFDSKVRFILMNSFSTSEDTRAFLAQHHPDLLKVGSRQAGRGEHLGGLSGRDRGAGAQLGVAWAGLEEEEEEEEQDGAGGWMEDYELWQEAHIELMQNKSPKVDAASLGPASYPSHPDNEWCPPGHGDIYPSLLGSGMLEQLLGEGVRYLFVSNSDNLGACLDLTLLSYFADSGKAFVMEVCERSAADKKGGHLCQRKADGSLILRESAQCPDADKAAFEDIDKHRFFNTNNLYVDLEQLKARLEECGGLLRLPLIKNKKTVNPRDSKSPPVFQLETAMGSAIECFNNTGAVVVPRSRFAPVKTCADLLVLRSDCYTIHENATVGAAVDKLPLVKLDDAHYKLVDQLEALVPPGEEPSLLQASALTVKGPVKFTKGVTVVGSVTFQAAPGSSSPASLAAGTYTDTTLTVGEPALVPARNVTEIGAAQSTSPAAMAAATSMIRSTISAHKVSAVRLLVSAAAAVRPPSKPAKRQPHISQPRDTFLPRPTLTAVPRQSLDLSAISIASCHARCDAVGVQVVVFSKTYCPYCIKAKKALSTYLKPQQYEVVELDGRPDMDAIQDALKELTGGRSVPRVFVGGEFIGGGDDTAAKASNGELEKLLVAQGVI